jgi:nitrate reductase NapD
MNIAGVLIHAYPGEQERARAALLAIDGVEVHHETGDGRFIVTVEDGENTSCDDTVLALQNTPGIASAALVYHSFESEDINPNTSAELAVAPASPNRGA